MISIIIPVLNEEKALPQTLKSILDQTRLRQPFQEIIIVDGGSTDNSVALAKEFATSLPIKIVHSKQGRAIQMNIGAQTSSARWLLFLHADTRLPHDGIENLYQSINTNNVKATCFKHSFSGKYWGLKFISWLHNTRFHRTKIIYGDQAMMVKHEIFFSIGGFPEQKTEDILFSQKLLTVCEPIMINSSIVTDSRKFEQIGTWRALIYVIAIQFQHRLGKVIRHPQFFHNYR